MPIDSVVSMTCPSEPEILLHALESSADPPDAIARHLSACESCRSQVADLRRVMRGIESSASTARADGSACLDEIAFAALVRGGADEESRTLRIAHLAACGHCRRQLTALVELLAAPTVVDEIQSIERTNLRWTSRRRRLSAAGLVAAAVVFLVVWPRGDEQPAVPLHRAPTITGTAPPAAVSPIGDVAAARMLRWGAVAGSDRYRVTLFDATGHVLFEAQLADTAATLPHSVVVVPGRSYLWKVEARAGFERWASSELVEFRVREGRSE